MQTFVKNIDGCVPVPLMDSFAVFTPPPPAFRCLLEGLPFDIVDGSAAGTGSGGVLRVYPDQGLAVPLGLVFQFTEKIAASGLLESLGWIMPFHHVLYAEVFHDDGIELIYYPPGKLVVEIVPLASELVVLLTKTEFSFFPTLGAFLLPAQPFLDLLDVF